MTDKKPKSFLEDVKKKYGEYKACHNYVKALEDLPPTYDTTNMAKTVPIPDLDFKNDKLLEAKFKAVDDARNDVINKCGFDPAKKF